MHSVKGAISLNHNYFFPVNVFTDGGGVWEPTGKNLGNFGHG